MLPTVVDNSYNFGHIHKSLFGHEIPIGSSVSACWYFYLWQKPIGVNFIFTFKSTF